MISQIDKRSNQIKKEREKVKSYNAKIKVRTYRPFRPKHQILWRKLDYKLTQLP